MAEASSTIAGAYKCPICLDILQDPVRIACPYKHVYCLCCATSLQETELPTCPECRCEFNPNQLERADDIAKILASKKTSCQWCKKLMLVGKMREHISSCPDASNSIPKFKPIKETSQPMPINVPNRSTFSCPYCEEKNFDSNSLIKHCNKLHKSCPQRLVCPICASMPWGDKSHVSGNLLQHLNFRHKFEYETYVDFERDDDTMLQEALRASMQDY